MSTENLGAAAPTSQNPSQQAATPAAPASTMPPATGVLHPSQIPMPGHVIAPTPSQHQQSQQQQGKTYSDESIVNAICRATGRDANFIREYIATKGNGDAMAVFETVMRDAVGTLQEREASATQAPVNNATTATGAQTTVPGMGPDGRIALADGWKAAVREVERNGKRVYEPVLPEYQNIANAANHNLLIEQRQAEIWRTNPAEAIRNDPTIKEMIQNEAKALFQDQWSQQQKQQLRAKYFEKHKQAYEQDQNGQVRVDLNGKPILTPLGRAYYRIGNELMQAGHAEDDSLYTRAWILAQNEVGVQQAASDMGQQSMNNSFGMGMQPHQYASQRQPYYPVGSVLQNAQTIFPAGNTQAQPTSAGDVTMEGALWNAVRDMPEDLSAGEYLEEISRRGGTKNWGKPPSLR